MRRLVVGVLIAWALILSGLFLAGCGSEATAKTWPEVVDRHWFALGLLISWGMFCVVLIAGAIWRESPKATEKSS